MKRWSLCPKSVDRTWKSVILETGLHFWLGLTTRESESEYNVESELRVMHVLTHHIIRHSLIKPISQLFRKWKDKFGFKMFFLVVVYFYIEAMREIECTAPSSTFPYKIDCAKFITIRKATNEKMINPEFDNFCVHSWINSYQCTWPQPEV